MISIGIDPGRTALRNRPASGADEPRRRRGASFFADIGGNAFVELGLVLPFAIVLLTGIFEFGMAVYTGHSIEHGARAGAQYAIVKGLDTAGIQAAVQSASQIPVSSLTVNSRQFCECSDSYGTEVTCTTTCTGSVPLAHFIEVTVQHAYTPIFPFLSSMTPTAINGAATVRVP